MSVFVNYIVYFIICFFVTGWFMRRGLRPGRVEKYFHWSTLAIVALTLLTDFVMRVTGQAQALTNLLYAGYMCLYAVYAVVAVLHDKMDAIKRHMPSATTWSFFAILVAFVVSYNLHT